MSGHLSQGMERGDQGWEDTCQCWLAGPLPPLTPSVLCGHTSRPHRPTPGPQDRPAGEPLPNLLSLCTWAGSP